MKNPGDFKFYSDGKTDPTGILFICPCGCGDVLAIPLTGEKAWTWNGNKEKPTITPSIKRVTGCGWHGHITEGKFVEIK